MKGKVLKSVQIKSEIMPLDIAVTRSGDLVYAKQIDRSINLVSGTQIQTLIRLRGWETLGLCTMSSGDLMVIMLRYYKQNSQTRVVRYSDSKEKQWIQWDDNGQPLNASDCVNIKYVTENRNLDICVADWNASAVVVVSAASKLRFRYTDSPSTSRKFFDPHGITTDSQANILTADFNNARIHIID